MRDIFHDIFVGQPTDPVEAARRAMRPPLRRRFYETASVQDGEGDYAVLLDGKPVRTPAHRQLSAPTVALAEAIAAEWLAQAAVIDPARMPLTRLANSIIDGVVSEPDPARREIVKYIGSDLVFYRAAGPAGLVQREQRHWDPIVAWARDALGARFVLAEGIVHAHQPEPALAAAAAAIPGDPWRLGAVHSITTLSGSALIALAVAYGRLSLDAAWAAAHVDEDFNMEQWGRDVLALERRSFRRAEMEAAATVIGAIAG
ncbi:MAG: ATP12 family chaperone protein [Xanthobacteraceae bacterium]